jgi:hypothetical protein
VTLITDRAIGKPKIDDVLSCLSEEHLQRGDATPPQARKPIRIGGIFMEHGGSIHYHIRWSDSSLDWKPFPMKEEAATMAEQIKKPNESYTIVECDDKCERCKALKSRANSAF